MDKFRYRITKDSAESDCVWTTVIGVVIISLITSFAINKIQEVGESAIQQFVR